MRILSYLAILSLVVACSDGGLTPSHAAAQLSVRFAASPDNVYRIFRTKCVEKYFERYPIRFIEDVRTAREYRELEQAGLATQFAQMATSERCGTPYPESLRIIGIVLTDRGRILNWPEHQEREGGWDIVLGQRRLIEVTAITPQSDNLARVNFQWRVVPSAGGAALGQTDEARGGSATFQENASGWQFLRMCYSLNSGT